MDRPSKRTYTVDICALYKQHEHGSWVFEFRVWCHTDTWQGRLPPQVFEQMLYTGIGDEVKEAAQTFLELVKLKMEGGEG
jgi:hypothetical protein